MPDPWFRHSSKAARGIAALRAIGLAAIVVAAWFGAAGRPGPLPANLAISVGIVCLVGFLWLVLTGFFGYGSLCRSDWVGAFPFVVALAVRQLFTLHSLEGIEIQFATRFEVPSGPVGKHSVLYPLLQLFLAPMRDAQSFTMALNGCLGALASLSMYLFVRQRTARRIAGLLAALFLALHPLVARFSPTDGPYSLLLATWFSGLALLSSPALDGRGLVGGAGLLGIAATLRLEGVLVLVASAVMLDRRILLAAARQNRTAAGLSLLLVAGLGALQMVVFLPSTIGGTLMYVPEGPPFQTLELFLWPIRHNGIVFAALVAIGVASGIAPKQRLGLLAFVAMLPVAVPVLNSTQATGLHRLIPTCALQALVAGMGAHAATTWLLARRRWRWLAPLPGLAAFYILFMNRGELTKSYFFNEEYALVRSHLGERAEGCGLFVLQAREDEDIHNFHDVVPNMIVVDCRVRDCSAAVSNDRCWYYLRSAAAYFHDAGLPATCSAPGGAAGADRTGCLNEPAASFEKSVRLEAVEVRLIDVGGTFPDLTPRYPERMEIGLFRVRPQSRP
jgi:hypothetical protein